MDHIDFYDFNKGAEVYYDKLGVPLFDGHLDIREAL